MDGRISVTVVEYYTYMRSSSASERGGGREADAVDTALDAPATLDEAGVRTLIGYGVARLDDAGRLGVADDLLAEVGDPAALTVAGKALGRLAGNPLGGDVDDAALAASVERLQRLEATVAGEKLRGSRRWPRAGPAGRPVTGRLRICCAVSG